VRHKLDESYGRLVRRRELKQGDNMLTFYEPLDGSEPRV
jgi:hypothetical protein